MSLNFTNCSCIFERISVCLLYCSCPSTAHIFPSIAHSKFMFSSARFFRYANFVQFCNTWLSILFQFKNNRDLLSLEVQHTYQLWSRFWQPVLVSKRRFVVDMPECFWCVIHYCFHSVILPPNLKQPIRKSFAFVPVKFH